MRRNPLVRTDPRDFFAWRLPTGPAANILTDEDTTKLRALPEPLLVDLVDRTETAARELASLAQQMRDRWTVVRACPMCDMPVLGRSDKVYCSAACKQVAYVSRSQPSSSRASRSCEQR